MDDPKQDPAEQDYEAPKAEDVETEDAPSVTAAGKTAQNGNAA